MVKKLLALLLVLPLAFSPLAAFADEVEADLKINEALPAAALADENLPAKSAVLMDQTSGQILYEKNANEQLPPASITKVMTLLLVMEAIEKGKITLDDKVVASEHASSMGGSQIWLEPGEEMTVNELLKAVCIASANDASVALAEHVAGSEEAFVDMMNIRAFELYMDNTHFLNTTGLDEEGHMTTAKDIAIMSRELINHPLITQYSTIWMDELRGGQTQLVNTNKLVRFYKGTTGLKTGTTSDAGSCLSATATRDGLSLVAVVMGSPTSNDRFSSARGLLDYGFANYTLVDPPSVEEELTPVKVLRGAAPEVLVEYEKPQPFIIDKLKRDSITHEVTLASDVQAPVEKGQTLGKVEVLVDGKVVSTYSLTAQDDVARMTFFRGFATLLRSLLKMSSAPKANEQEPVVDENAPENVEENTEAAAYYEGETWQTPDMPVDGSAEAEIETDAIVDGEDQARTYVFSAQGTGDEVLQANREEDDEYAEEVDNEEEEDMDMETDAETDEELAETSANVEAPRAQWFSFLSGGILKQ